MKGGAYSRFRGFTIIETLIALSISMALFLAATIFISGKQGNTEFTQSVRQLQGDLQQVINEVGSGHYPNVSGIKCNILGNGDIHLNSIGSDTQGSNKECVFLGRAIQFRITPDGNAYNVYTIVAKNDATTLASADPRLIARSTTDGGNVPDEFDALKIRYDGTVVRMRYNNSVDISAIAFVTNIGSASIGDGSQQIQLLAIPNTTPTDKPNGVTEINANLTSATVNPPGGVQICINSGSNNQSAEISLGNNSRANSVEAKFFGSPGCV